MKWRRRQGAYRKLTGSALAQTLVFGWLEHPEASYQQLTETAALLGIQVSRQALEQRLTPETAEMLKLTLEAAMRKLRVARTCLYLNSLPSTFKIARGYPCRMNFSKGPPKKNRCFETASVL